MKKLFLALLVAVTAATSAHAAERKGTFGFKLDAETSGSPLNPTVKVARIKEVAPGSPAAAQHLAAGDEVVQADGKTVAGSQALDLRPIIKKAPGETIHLRLKRGSGEIYSVTLTAVKKSN